MSGTGIPSVANKVIAVVHAEVLDLMSEGGARRVGSVATGDLRFVFKLFPLLSCEMFFGARLTVSRDGKNSGVARAFGPAARDHRGGLNEWLLVELSRGE